MGDYRDLDRCAPARLLAALDLAADPANALAWRSWCGFGDYLANSAAFADMRAGAAAEGAGLVALLEEASAAAPAEGFPNTGIGRIVDAYRAGRELVASVQGLEGDGLLDALAAGLGLEGDGAARARALVGALTAPAPGEEGGTDAATLSRRARRALGGAAFGEHRGPGCRGRPRAPRRPLAGRARAGRLRERLLPQPRTTSTPRSMTPDKQKLARATDIRRLYAAAGKPTERLVASWFTSIDLVGAEQLKLEIGRVRLRRGERIATTSPSIYLKEIEPTEDQSA